MNCIHCHTRPVMAKPNAKVCKPCFLFGMAKLLDDQGILPGELDALTVEKTAEIFGAEWDAYALKCYVAVSAYSRGGGTMDLGGIEEAGCIT